MKKLHIITCLACVASAMMLGCKKDPIVIEPVASLNVANAVIGGKTVGINSGLRDSVYLNDYKLFSIHAGSGMQISASSKSATDFFYYKATSDIGNGGIYSLFLTGTQAAPEAVFVQDNIPPYPDADVMNVRVANLSTNSPALDVDVTLLDNTTNKVFKSVAYKQVSDFVTLSLPGDVAEGTTMLFEFKNAAGDLLGTYTLQYEGTVSVNQSRHRNITLVVKGLIDATDKDAFGVFGMANY